MSFLSLTKTQNLKPISIYLPTKLFSLHLWRFEYFEEGWFIFELVSDLISVEHKLEEMKPIDFHFCGFRVLSLKNWVGKANEPNSPQIWARTYLTSGNLQIRTKNHRLNGWKLLFISSPNYDIWSKKVITFKRALWVKSFAKFLDIWTTNEKFRACVL